MTSPVQEAFLSLVRLGLGRHAGDLPQSFDWSSIKALAEQQGLLGIELDGLDQIPSGLRPLKKDRMQLIGSVLQDEEQYAVQWESACEMAQLFANHAIRTYVLKGYVIAECYPKPTRRKSADMDCFLLPANGTGDVWELGNQLVEKAGFEVSRGFYKNSTFYLPGLMVENHKFMVPLRGNKTFKKLEKMLQGYLRADAGEDKIEGTALYRPPVMASALFLIEHAYSHFLHEGLTWRQVLDWMLFRAKHEQDIDWPAFESHIDTFGFRRFYDAYCHLGQYLLGDLPENALTIAEKRMLADIWAPLDITENPHGLKGKLSLAGSTLRARWKYRTFAEISMPKALWIWIMGYLLDRHPTLD
jgi:hypothetical protein